MADKRISSWTRIKKRIVERDLDKAGITDRPIRDEIKAFEKSCNTVKHEREKRLTWDYIETKSHSFREILAPTLTNLMKNHLDELVAYQTAAKKDLFEMSLRDYIMFDGKNRNKKIRPSRSLRTKSRR